MLANFENSAHAIVSLLIVSERDVIDEGGDVLTTSLNFLDLSRV